MYVDKGGEEPMMKLEVWPRPGIGWRKTRRQGHQESVRVGQGGKIHATKKSRKSKKQDIAEKVLFGKGRFEDYWSTNNKLGAIWHSKRIKHMKN